MSRFRLATIAVAFVLAATAAAGAASPAPAPAPVAGAAVPHGAVAAGPENAGPHAAVRNTQFKEDAVARFDHPWAIAMIDASRVLVTERRGRLWLVTRRLARTEVSGVPAVDASGQNGLLDVVLAPDYARSRLVYLTYMEPGQGGSGLALARARLVTGARPRLDGLTVLWRQQPKGSGGQPGGVIAFSPDGRDLFLTVGDRMHPETAQNPDDERGKLLRLTPEGKPAPGNPFAAAGGVRAEIWTLGHRNPYGLAFDGAGRLWLHEMGPKGGDELNLIEPGKNYGWPLVSYGDQYSGTPIDRPPTRPDLDGPALYWTPVIAPSRLAFYHERLFRHWAGAALIGGLKTQSLSVVTFDAAGRPHEAERIAMGARIRDVAVAPDGAVWVIEDAANGRLLRLTPPIRWTAKSLLRRFG